MSIREWWQGKNPLERRDILGVAGVIAAVLIMLIVMFATNA